VAQVQYLVLRMGLKAANRQCITAKGCGSPHLPRGPAAATDLASAARVRTHCRSPPHTATNILTPGGSLIAQPLWPGLVRCLPGGSRLTAPDALHSGKLTVYSGSDLSYPGERGGGQILS